MFQYGLIMEMQLAFSILELLLWKETWSGIFEGGNCLVYLVCDLFLIVIVRYRNMDAHEDMHFDSCVCVFFFFFYVYLFDLDVKPLICVAQILWKEKATSVGLVFTMKTCQILLRFLQHNYYHLSCLLFKSKIFKCLLVDCLD